MLTINCTKEKEEKKITKAHKIANHALTHRAQLQNANKITTAYKKNHVN